MDDIFDEIIQCLQKEKDQYGTVFVTPDSLSEFFADPTSRQSAPASPQLASAPAAPPRRMAPPPQRPVSMQTAQNEAMDADFHSSALPASVRKYPPLDPEAVSKMDWSALKKNASVCRSCGLCETRKHIVFSDGSEHAPLMFIGEGPGADEDEQGVPFVGKAGQLLTKMISAMQFRREEVYIANIVKCRPPENRNPTDDEMAACIAYLHRQIELVSPKVIVLLGSVALKGLLNRTGIVRMRGHWLDYRGIMVMPTFHPAYLLRYEAAKKDVWSDLLQVMKVFGKVYQKPSQAR